MFPTDAPTGSIARHAKTSYRTSGLLEWWLVLQGGTARSIALLSLNGVWCVSGGRWRRDGIWDDRADWLVVDCEKGGCV